MTVAIVTLWGTEIGVVSMDETERYARFEFYPDFAQSGIEVAPIMMPAQAGRIYQFRDLDPRSFYGLPGLLADSLPDRYGNRLINVWLAKTGRKPSAFNAVDRLCYTGKRGMGALEFEPTAGPGRVIDAEIEVEQLVELASLAFARKETLDAKIDEGDDQGLLDVLALGTSAGGARAKAVIAFDPKTQQVRSGQVDLKEGFEHWLIKFDGVAMNGDWGVTDPAGYGLVEYSYHLMAKQCGIDMMECRLLSENGRNHFMTRRYDREGGEKQFVQSFAALNHFDYYESGAYSYEQLFMTMRELGLPQPAFEEQFRRIVFNLVGCNQDDHVKNFGFMMDKAGQWSLTPAYDLCHAEGSNFTRAHQLSLNGKRQGFTMGDLKYLANYAGLPQGRERIVLDRTLAAFQSWEAEAQKLDVPKPLTAHVQNTLRLEWR